MAAQSPAAAASSRPRMSDFKDVITVLVGESEVRFTVHPDVISTKSDFFKAAVGGGFQEAKEKLVRLPETDPEVFHHYLQWAYFDRVEGQLEEDTPDLRLAYVNLYLLAQYLVDPRLQNTMVDLLVKDFRDEGTGPDADVIEAVWSSTTDSDKMRQLILDWHVDASDHKWLPKHRDEIPAAFFADLAINLAELKSEKKTAQDPLKAEKCKYHCHDDKLPPCTASS